MREIELEISAPEELYGTSTSIEAIQTSYENLRDIKSISIKNMMLFDSINISPCNGINVIHGENSTGKTALLKTLYVLLKSVCSSGFNTTDITKGRLDGSLVEKFKGVFRPDNGDIGRLVNNASNSNALIAMILDNEETVEFSIGKQAREHVEISSHPTKRITNEIVYIPPKEIISSSENFESLYREYHIAFEETYVDLIQQLDKPEKKEINEKLLKNALKSLNDIVGGEIIHIGKKFYIRDSTGIEIEMGLLSEGYRKIATLIQLLKNGSIRKGTILIWDEPETNMNPKMIKPLMDALMAVQKIGVCIVIATHDYFVQQEIQMNAPTNGIRTQFLSLYRDNGTICLESKERAYMLDHNPIMEEFDAMYDREQELMESGKYN